MKGKNQGVKWYNLFMLTNLYLFIDYCYSILVLVVDLYIDWFLYFDKNPINYIHLIQGMVTNVTTKFRFLY